MLSQETVETLTVYLWDDLNNLAQGWKLGREVDSHTRVTFTLYYAINNPETIDDFTTYVNRHELLKIANKYRWVRDDRDTKYLRWHNRSRDVTDNADRYAGKSPVLFVNDLIELYHKYVEQDKYG